MAKKIFKTGSGKTTYPSDVTDEEWAFCAPYLTLMKEDAPQREHSLRRVFNAVRYMVRAGCPWHLIPNDFPPSSIVYQQTQRWIAAGCFEALTHDLRKLLRMLADKAADPSAAILDGRTLQSTPESGERAG
jgi:transposase